MSERHRDRMGNTIAACAGDAAALERIAYRYADRIESLRESSAAHQALIGDLEEALAPFAAAADAMDGSARGPDDDWGLWEHSAPTGSTRILVRDCRRARAALQRAEAMKGE